LPTQANSSTELSWLSESRLSLSQQLIALEVTAFDRFTSLTRALFELPGRQMLATDGLANAVIGIGLTPAR
jgi:hypothetical protein